jgi:hypothetical protein
LPPRHPAIKENGPCRSAPVDVASAVMAQRRTGGCEREVLPDSEAVGGAAPRRRVCGNADAFARDLVAVVEAIRASGVTGLRGAE